jgi:hypothetical protein
MMGSLSLLGLPFVTDFEKLLSVDAIGMEALDTMDSILSDSIPLLMLWINRYRRSAFGTRNKMLALPCVKPFVPAPVTLHMSCFYLE